MQYKYICIHWLNQTNIVINGCISYKEEFSSGSHADHYIIQVASYSCANRHSFGGGWVGVHYQCLPPKPHKAVAIQE